MVKFEKKIITPIASLRSKNNILSSLSTQCLFGENIDILKTNRNWSFCKCKLDNYIGWIKNEAIGYLPKATHLVSNISTLVFEKPDIKSNLICNLYLNSQVTKLNETKNWAEIALNQNKTGFVPINHLRIKKEPSKDWINTAKKFKNTPYLWGGKSYLGIDCSGLVQSSLQASGINIPRDSSEQLFFYSSKIKNVDFIKKGCLIFWKGHVAIAISPKIILHSNAFHMSVKEESLEQALNRFSSQDLKILRIKQVFSNKIK